MTVEEQRATPPAGTQGGGAPAKCPECHHGAEHTESYRGLIDRLRRLPARSECRQMTLEPDTFGYAQEFCGCRHPWHVTA